MQHLQTPTYGVRLRDPDGDAVAQHAEELRRLGYTILPDVYPDTVMDAAADRLDKLLVLQTDECGGAEAVTRARDADVVRCPLAYDASMLAFACEPSVLSVARSLLGDSLVLLMQNAVINRPAKLQEQSRYHRDLNYQHWTSSRPLALNYLVCVDDFFEAGGGTWVLPGSHLHESFPSKAFVDRHEVPIESKRGAVVMMDAMLYHRSGTNETADYTRRAINHVVGAPLLAQQIDIPRLLASRGRDHSSDPSLSGFLGYRWNPAADIREWRQKHTGTM